MTARSVGLGAHSERSDKSRSKQTEKSFPASSLFVLITISMKRGEEKKALHFSVNVMHLVVVCVFYSSMCIGHLKILSSTADFCCVNIVVMCV